MGAKSAYQRILLKLSGEALMGDQKFGVNQQACQKLADNIKELDQLGVQLGIVVGGGNIFRGDQAKSFGFDRTPADHVGMLSTAINGLLLSQMLAEKGCKTRVMSAVNLGGFVEIYNWKQANLYLQKGVIVLFVGGTGNPYFTTDTAAAMRASEIHADILLKATKVDGVFDKDPEKSTDAIKYEKLSYADVLSQNLKVMDATAVALCRENQIPIRVINFFADQSLINAVCHKKGGTLVEGE